MLAGGAPLHAERLAVRGGPADAVHDELTFFDVSSYGPRTVDAMLRVVGADRLVHGSDRPVAEPPLLGALGPSRRPRPGRGQPRSPAVPRPRDRLMLPTHLRDLDADALTELVEGLAARPETWRHLVSHRPDARTYEQLHRDDHVAVWLICWMNDHDTGFHDHDLSAGALSVVRGSVREERLVLGGAPVEPHALGGRVADLRRLRHPPRRARGQRARGHAARLLAAAVADGRLRGLARTARCAATRCPTPRSCARSTRARSPLSRSRAKGETPGLWPGVSLEGRG